MRLTLVLPELIWPEPGDKTALEKLLCPALEWLLARGNAGHAPSLPYEHALAAAFGLPGDDGSLPFGALRLLGEDSDAADARTGRWLCADPVHLRFHHERIVLADAGAFALDCDEARALVEGLNREFPDIGEFHALHPRRWYVRLKADGAFAAPPLSAVAGRRIDNELPEAPAARQLRAWQNEAQMFLHAHPVNAAREQVGKPAVNSLWLWGAGALPQLPAPRYDTVWANDPLAVGLARAGSSATQGKPSGLDKLLAQADPNGAYLAVLDDLLEPCLYENSHTWRDALRALESGWFAPLRQALGGRIDSLELLAPTVYGRLSWQLKGMDRWKAWRRPQTLAILAEAFAEQFHR